MRVAYFTRWSTTNGLGRLGGFLMPRKRPSRRVPRRPSYEDGRVRDPSITEKQDPEYDKEDLKGVLRRFLPRRANSPP